MTQALGGWRYGVGGTLSNEKPGSNAPTRGPKSANATSSSAAALATAEAQRPTENDLHYHNTIGSIVSSE